MQPETVEGDWNRLYSEFPEVYDAFAAVDHGTHVVVAERVPLEGAVVADVGSGTGRSTFQLAARAASVVGIEPNPAMRAVAERHAAELGVANVTFVDGSASALPLADTSVDVVAAITGVFWPAEEIVPAFVAESLRVLRPGGVAFVLNTAPGWYGGELRDVAARPALDYELALDSLLEQAGFDVFDFETLVDYGTVEHAVATYGFVFGSKAVARLRERQQSRIRFRWRLRSLRAARTDRRAPPAARARRPG